MVVAVVVLQVSHAFVIVKEIKTQKKKKKIIQRSNRQELRKPCSNQAEHRARAPSNCRLLAGSFESEAKKR